MKEVIPTFGTPLLRGCSESSQRRAMKRSSIASPGHCVEARPRIYSVKQTNTQEYDVDDEEMPTDPADSMTETKYLMDRPVKYVRTLMTRDCDLVSQKLKKFINWGLDYEIRAMCGKPSIQAALYILFDDS